MNQCYRLGIDIGSTTVKVAVIDDNNKILFADYERHYANIQETLASLLKKCKGELGELSLRPNITGSGGLTLSGYLHIPFVQEVVAVATALQDYAPRTDVAIELGGEDEQKDDSESAELMQFVKETLGDQVASVRLSNKLVSSAVCLSTEGGVTLEMERYFKSMPGAPTDIRAIRVLELNANHHAYQAMKEAFDAGDKDKAARIAKILHAQALLIAGEPLEDPAAYSELVCTLI